MKPLKLKVMVRKEENREGLTIRFNNTKRLNILNREIIKRELDQSLRNNYKSTILDLGGIEFIDSSVFSVLLEHEKRAELRGRKFHLSNVSEDVKELIHLLNLHEVLDYGAAA